jgi:transposase-like protein
VNKELHLEVDRLVGDARYGRESTRHRWGSNPGSIVLGGQKFKIEVPRVRDKVSKDFVPLKSYQELRGTGELNEEVYRLVLGGISTGRYEEAGERLPEAFGISGSSVSRRFKEASAARLKALFQRDLSQDDIVAVFLDGKSFGGEQLIIGLGITAEGEKRVLGLVESSTENGKVCQEFLQSLVERGLKYDQGILFIIDGAKGLHKGIRQVFGKKAVIQRCQWHKRENVLAYLSKANQKKFRSKLQKAYEKPTYEEAKKDLMAIRGELESINQSAVNSLDEGLEETLALHKMGVFNLVGKSFKTTNCIENLNRQIEQRTGRVSNWKNSNQRQRWVASALLDIEPKLNKVAGYQYLPILRAKILEMTEESDHQKAA